MPQFCALPGSITPLFFAVCEGHIDVVRVLLDAGVNVNVTAIQRLMAAAGVSTDGTRPRIRDIYEKLPVAPETPKKP